MATNTFRSATSCFVVTLAVMYGISGSRTQQLDTVQVGESSGSIYTVTSKGCSDLKGTVVCNVSLRLTSTTPGPLELTREAYLLSPDGVKALVSELSWSGGAARTGDLRLQLEPDIPISIQLHFTEVPKDWWQASLVVKIRRGETKAAVLKNVQLGGRTQTEQAVRKPVTAKFSQGGVSLSLHGCSRNNFNLHCELTVENLSPNTIPWIPRLVPYGEPDHYQSSFYRDESGKAYRLAQLYLGNERRNLVAPFSTQFEDIDPGAPLRLTVTVPDVNTTIQKGSLTLRFNAGRGGRDDGYEAVFKDVAVAANSSVSADAAPRTQRQESWLVSLDECYGSDSILACTGSVFNGALTDRYFHLLPDPSYVVAGDEQYKARVVKLAEKVLLSNDPTGRTEAGSVRVPADGKVDFAVFISGVEEKQETVHVVLGSFWDNPLPLHTFTLRDIPITWGKRAMLPLERAPAKPQPVRTVVADAQATRLRAVIRDSKTPAEREEAADILWHRYGDRSARQQLIISYEALLHELSTGAGSICMQGYVESPNSPCGRMKRLLRSLPEFPEPALLSGIVGLIGTGRISREEYAAALTAVGLPALGPVRQLLLRERSLKERLLEAGWTPERINRLFTEVLEIVLRLQSIQDR